MKLRNWLPLLLLFPLGACIENKEEIEVRADGSVRVIIRADGDLADFGHGYAVPLHAPWRPLDEFTERWIATVGPDTGSAATDLAIEQGRAPWTRMDEEKPKAAFGVETEFTGVETWPRYTTPTHEPYRTAYLERSADLTVEEKGGMTVYTLRRTFHSREWSRFHFEPRFGPDRLEEVGERIDDDDFDVRRDLAVTVNDFRQVIHDLAYELAHDALAKADPDGTIVTAEQRERVAARLQREGAQVASVERLMRLFELIRAESLGQEGEGSSREGESIGEDLRAASRLCFDDELEQLGLDEPLRNAVLEAFEWRMTFSDHTEDLTDENFEVKVTLPGTIVAGNFDEADERTAKWKVEFEQFADEDYVLEVVSVVP